MPQRSPIILFVDDEPDIVDIARMCFELGGWRVVTASGVESAKTVLANERVDAVLSDVMMGDSSGLDLLEHVRAEHGPEFIFFLLTGCIDHRVKDAMDRGAHGVFNKPCNWTEVVQALHDAVQAKLQLRPG